MSEDWVSEKHSLHDMIPYLESPKDWWLSAAQSIKEDECGHTTNQLKNIWYRTCYEYRIPE
jgi:hypothetical protein